MHCLGRILIELIVFSLFVQSEASLMVSFTLRLHTDNDHALSSRNVRYKSTPSDELGGGGLRDSSGKGQTKQC